MIRILHLTDSHLNEQTLKDWNDYYKKAFLEKLDELQKDSKFHLVLFTGDMIDKAGKEFGSVTDALAVFKQNIIEPIVSTLNINLSQFIICPGNHDINRDADKPFHEKGIKAQLADLNAVNNFIESIDDEFDGVKRIMEYKQFEVDLYKDITVPKLQDKFLFSLKLNIENTSIGISSINSAWRCYNNDDLNNILIGENQVNNNYKFIDDCSLKIAIMHHQLEWVKDFERTIITSHLSKNYDLIFSGHVHQTDVQVVQNCAGKSARIISPSQIANIRETDSDFSCGFSVINYSQDSLECSFFKYNHKIQKMVDNTDVCDKGSLSFNLFGAQSSNDEKPFLELEHDFIEFLIDSGANFTHRTKKLSLDDIYVLPFLEKFNLLENEEKSSSVGLESVIRKIEENEVQHTVVLGDENIGKTSFCKQLYKRLFMRGMLIPVYIKGRDIKGVADRDIENLISKELKNQYKNIFNLSDVNLEEYRKIIIIDDLNNCNLPLKSKRNFINYLQSSSYQTIFTWDEFFTLGELLESHSIKIEIYEILKFGAKKRLELIRKWIDLIDEDFQDESEKEYQINQLFKLVNGVIGKNLIPSLPIYILTILQANELTSKTNLEQSTFGHYYDVLIKSAIGQRIKDNKEIEKYYSYMSELSNRLFKKRNSFELDESEMIGFHEFFNNEYKLKIGFRDTITVLEDSNLLVRSNNTYKFKYKYIYFYFIGKYLSDNIEDDEIRKDISELSEKLYQVESANIYIFLSHHSKSSFVIGQILERGKELFHERTELQFNDDIRHINNLIENVTDKIDFDNSIPLDEQKNQEFEIIENSDIEDVANLENQDVEKHIEIDSISQINRAFKTIEILGYIVKTRYASLKGKDKEELVEELYKLSLRSLSFLFETLLEGEEFIKNEIIDVFKKDPNSVLTTREREGLAKQVIFNLLYMISYSIFKRISNSVSTKDLEITFADVKSKLLDTPSGQKNNAISLIDMAVIFEFSKNFPDAQVGQLTKEFKKNPLAFSILRRLGINYMRMMPMKENEQQKASELLNISMKNQRAISGKSAIIKK